jgi:type 1 fimbria pilin
MGRGFTVSFSTAIDKLITQIESKDAMINTTDENTEGGEACAGRQRSRRSTRCSKRLARFLGVGLLMLGSIHAQASYVHNPYNKPFIANYDNLSFSGSFSPAADTPVGTVLQSVSSSPGISYSSSCTITKTVTVNGTPVPGMADTYQTNVPGIGVHFYVTAGWAGNTYISVPSTEALPPVTTQQGNFSTRADLVFTGPVGTGTLTDLPSMTVQYSSSCLDSGSSSPHIQALNPGTTINGRTCSVTNRSVNVTLPSISSNSVSAGPAGTTPLNLDVLCNQGVTVKVTLTDASNPANTSTTLGLTPGSTALGVGLQILTGTTPIAYGADSNLVGNLNQWTAGISGGGPMSIPLTARYIRTTEVITPGTVKGAATFTMSYQ